MKAVVVREYGAPSVLRYEEVPTPSPAPDEVIVRVHAAGVGLWDALVRTGKSGLPQSLPLTPGSDVAGTVFLPGERVTAFRTGEAVYGDTNARFIGGYAEFAACSAGKIARKPASLNYVEAASVPVVAVTAWQMLFDHAKLKAGQSVLIHGAAGNVGLYAVQLAKNAGGYVIASASGADREYLEKVRVDRFIDYRAERFEDAVKDVDIVIDTVGGDALHRSFNVVKRGGVIVSSVAQPSQEDAERAGARGEFFYVDVTTDYLNDLSRLFDTGALKTHVGEVLTLDQARDAHEMLGGAPHRPGKIVLTIDGVGK
jgi:NADPH:quinone reductase-like Zn-dependent oxidoreductase